MSFEIRPLTASDSIGDLTLLIRRSYKVLADLGFNYTGTYQDEATTAKRIADGECYVIGDTNRIVGTIMLYPPDPVTRQNSPRWYGNRGVSRCGQFAVEPELQRQGLGSRLMDFVEQRAVEIGAVELALDTSEGATHLIRFYTNRGYRLVEFTQYEGKTYRSVILSKALRSSLA